MFLQLDIEIIFQIIRTRIHMPCAGVPRQGADRGAGSAISRFPREAADRPIPVFSGGMLRSSVGMRVRCAVSEQKTIEKCPSEAAHPGVCFGRRLVQPTANDMERVCVP